jgi:asparagine synthase (glutamine-hydrolysing)
LSLTSEGSPFDEGPYVRKVENRIGCVGEKIDVGRDAVKFLNSLSEVQWYNDEPISSFSTVAYYQMMSRARELDIKVLLTGQGADEIFCGYKKYLGFYLQSLARQRKLLGFGREVVKFAANGGFVYDVQWSEVKRYIAPNEGNSVLGGALQGYESMSLTLDYQSLVERQVLDIEQTSIPALLHYEDRLSMAFSREVRVPFLDHRIVEFALSCPDEYRIGSGWTKYVLRKAIADVAPDEIVWRKDKNGFGVPQVDWLKKDLKPHVQKIFEGDCLMYDKQLIEKKSLLDLYASFRSSLFDAVSYKRVFAALALEVWLRRFAPYIA